MTAGDRRTILGRVRSCRPTLGFALTLACLILVSSASADPDDAIFKERERQALESEKGSHLDEAMRHFVAACRTETTPVLTVMRYSYCERAVELAGQLGRLDEARAWFGQDCSGGSDVACYVLARVEEKRHNPGTAVDLMENLCRQGFAWPPIHSLSACSESARLRELWITTDPVAARRSAAWMLLLLSLPAGGILALRKRALSRTLVRVAAWLVALPYAVLLLGRVSSWILMLALIPLSFYFLPPAFLFGKPHFMIGIGAGPKDNIGMLYAAGFYLCVACALALLVHGWKQVRSSSQGTLP